MAMVSEYGNKLRFLANFYLKRAVLEDLLPPLSTSPPLGPYTGPHLGRRAD